MKLLITSVFALAATLSPLSADGGDGGCKKKKGDGCKKKENEPALTLNYSNEDGGCKKKGDGCKKKENEPA